MNSKTKRDTKYDLKLIEKIRTEKNLFRLIVNSFCPEIVGQYSVKSGLVLALFGGLIKRDFESNIFIRRAQIHVLLFGDHGSNKDILLKAVHSMAPKAHYIYGNVSKMNSLTSFAKRIRRDQHFEKGCLESEEMAICCVDEFEKMDANQHKLIEEVMEYQTLTNYSKGITYDISGNTSVIAAINPLNGLYNWNLNVWQNTRLKQSLLKKFDLIFVLFDFPNEEMDIKIAERIIKSRNCNTNESNDSHKIKAISQTISSQINDSQLMRKVFVNPDEELDLIPDQLLKQYISYAEKNCFPVLNSEAISLLEEFCKQLETNQISKSQTQNIESFIRLTEARARVELRPVATKEDAEDVIDIVRASVGKLYKVMDWVTTLKIKTSFKLSKKSQNLKNLLKALKFFGEENQQKEFSFTEIVEICGKYEIPFESKDEIWIAVEKLNEQTFLLKNNSKYKLID